MSWNRCTPRTTASIDYKSFSDILPPDALPAVTLGPWVPVEYKTDELLIMRRNPYFWEVDEDGNQLPYIDEAVYQKGPSGVGRTLCTLAGGCDHTNLENPSSEYVEALKRAQEPDAQFKMNWGPEDLGFNLQLNQSETLGITNDRDKAIRELFRNDKFRQALSHSLDREGIAQSIMRGPFIRAFPGGLYPGSPEFDPQSVVYYGYDVERAKELLAEIGLEDTDNNGILNFTEGPAAGEDVVIALTTSQDAADSQPIGDQITAMFGAVGIKVNPRPMTSQAINDANTSGEWDMYMDRSDVYQLPFTRCAELAPLTQDYAQLEPPGRRRTCTARSGTGTGRQGRCLLQRARSCDTQAVDQRVEPHLDRAQLHNRHDHWTQGPCLGRALYERTRRHPTPHVPMGGRCHHV